MANNYCQSSTFVTIPKDKLGEAKSIVDKIETELEGGDEGYVGFVAELKENGVWIYDDESINPDHVEILIKALVEQLDLPGRHLCSWAYICSKPRIGEFGGGAFVVQKGKDTVWVDAEQAALRAAGISE
jgi:hypothetical protein